MTILCLQSMFAMVHHIALCGIDRVCRAPKGHACVKTELLLVWGKDCPCMEHCGSLPPTTAVMNLGVVRTISYAAYPECYSTPRVRPTTILPYDPPFFVSFTGSLLLLQWYRPTRRSSELRSNQSSIIKQLLDYWCCLITNIAWLLTLLNY